MDKGFTDDEVREAVQKIDCNSADYPVHKSEQWKVAMWATEQYLKAKPVIEWYADCHYDVDGTNAREFLNQIKS